MDRFDGFSLLSLPEHTQLNAAVEAFIPMSERWQQKKKEGTGCRSRAILIFDGLEYLYIFYAYYISFCPVANHPFLHSYNYETHLNQGCLRILFVSPTDRSTPADLSRNLSSSAAMTVR
jgi:hypothetical protein